MILILSEESDVHAQAVVEQLDRMGAESRILDLRCFPQQSRVRMRFEAGEPDVSALLEPEIDFAKVGAVWWRRPQPYGLDASVTDPGHQLFSLGECEELFGGLWSSLDAFWINEPKLDEVAHKKPFQLKLARKSGLRIPDTLMTNDPAAAQAFIDQHGLGQVVYKPFSATDAHWRETRLLLESEAQDLAAVCLAPLIFQEYVPCQCDLRVTVVGSKVFAASIFSQESDYQVDCRMNLSRVRIEATELPEEVQAALLDLMDRLGLEYGAADFRLTPEGEYVFLEVNPAGQWLFVEEATGQPIAESLASKLELEDRARRGGGTPALSLYHGRGGRERPTAHLV